MERRRFIAAVAGWAVILGAARAQDAKRVPRVGVLIAGRPDPIVPLFQKGLRALGYVDGASIRIEVRHVVDGNPDRLAAHARELVRSDCDVLIAIQTPAAHAAQQATLRLPIVISAGDPVGTGLVASLARPGGNITGYSGFTAELGGKVLQLIRELLPSVKRIAVLANAADPFTKIFLKPLHSAAPTARVEVRSYMVRPADDYADAFEKIVGDGNNAVIIQPSLARALAASIAHRHRLPTVSVTGIFTGEGGLMSYSSNIEEIYSGLAGYVDRILKGAKPADMPVQQPTRFDLRINLKTARALGIEVPVSLLLRADSVIE